MSFTTVATVLLLGFGPGLPDDAPRRWSFESDAPGKTAAGFSNEVGQWVVEAVDGGGHVLSQTAASPGPVFNVALARDTKAADVALSVRLRAVSGKEDQGGGLVWRARDARNYYVARFNPLEENFRVYKLVDGKRTQLGTAEVKRPPGWFTLKVSMSGDHIVCDLDGIATLDVHDATFPDAGMIGLWTKADAATRFDDLELGPAPTR